MFYHSLYREKSKIPSVYFLQFVYIQRKESSTMLLYYTNRRWLYVVSFINAEGLFYSPFDVPLPTYYTNLKLNEKLLKFATKDEEHAIRFTEGYAVFRRNKLQAELLFVKFFLWNRENSLWTIRRYHQEKRCKAPRFRYKLNSFNK